MLKEDLYEKIILVTALLVFSSFSAFEPPVKVPQEVLNRELVQAVQKNEVAKAHSLLMQGANPNAKYGQQTTVLEMAVFRANLRMVKNLLDAGADPSESPTLLCEAMKNVSSPVIDILIQHPKTNLNCVGKIRLGSLELSPLMHAARTSDYALADKLYATGRLDLNLVSPKGKTALDFAKKEKMYTCKSYVRSLKCTKILS